MTTPASLLRRTAGLLPAIAAAALLVACDRSVELAEDGSPVLARVGESVITAATFEEEMNRRAAVRPGYFDRAANRRELLEDLINHQAQLNAAREAGIEQDPEFRALVERLLIQRLRESRLTAALEETAVGDDEIRAYFDANPDQFGRPERRQVAMIRIDLPPRTDEDRRQQLLARAAEAREQALELPEDVHHFGAVAVSHSGDRGSRYQGGVVGWLVEGSEQNYRWPPAVLAAVPELEPGEVSEVIETDAALWLLRVVALEPARRQPLETVADGIRHRLTRERAAGLESGLMSELRAGQVVAVDESVLDAIPVPSHGPEDMQRPPPERRPPPLPIALADDTDPQLEIESDHD